MINCDVTVPKLLIREMLSQTSSRAVSVESKQRKADCDGKNIGQEIVENLVIT